MLRWRNRVGVGLKKKLKSKAKLNRSISISKREISIYLINKEVDANETKKLSIQ